MLMCQALGIDFMLCTCPAYSRKPCTMLYMYHCSRSLSVASKEASERTKRLLTLTLFHQRERSYHAMVLKLWRYLSEVAHHILGLAVTMLLLTLDI